MAQRKLDHQLFAWVVGLCIVFGVSAAILFVAIQRYRAASMVEQSLSLAAASLVDDLRSRAIHKIATLQALEESVRTALQESSATINASSSGEPPLDSNAPLDARAVREAAEKVFRYTSAIMHQDFSGFAFFTSSGVVCSSPTAYTPISPIMEIERTIAKISGYNPAVLWMNPGFDEGSKNWRVTLVAPLFMDGDYQGFVAADLILKNLFSDLLTFSRQQPWFEGFVYDNYGDIIARSDNMDELCAASIKKGSPTFMDITTPGLRDLVVETLKEPDKSRDKLLYQVGDKGHIASIIPIGDAGWMLALYAPEDALVEDPWMVRMSILSASALLAFCLALALRISLRRVVLNRISLLASAAERVAAGEWDVDLPSGVDDEVGALTGSFARMRDQLHDQMACLECRVEERTNELREREEQFRTLVQNIPGAIFRRRMTGSWPIVYASDGIMDITGYSAADFIEDQAVSFESIIHPDDHVNLRERMCDALDHDGQYAINYRIIRRDGQIRWVGEKARVTCLIEGNTCWIDGVMSDITERLQSGEQLKQLSQAVSQSPVSVVITNAQGDIVYVNPMFTEVTGYAADEARGKNPRFLKAGDLPARLYKDLWETILAGNIWRGELINRRKTGEVFWEAASISPIQDENGRVTHFVAVKEDITEAKIADEELRRAKRAAEEANRAKSDFLANMSHEIRTPMNAIIGMTHLALRTELTPRQQGYLDKIQYAANSLLGIINDILDFSKIEAGKLDMETVVFDLDTVLTSLADLIAVKAQEKTNLEVLFHCAPDVPRLLSGDPLRLGQVLTNLAGNAIKFTQRGEVIVFIEKAETTASSVTLHFMVKDTGIGLTPDELIRLFRPFTQADGSTTRQYGGTGLGLSISKRLVGMMNGEIWAESTPGEGSVFHFTARFGIAPSDASPARLPEHISPKGSKALVVDDNAIARDILGEMMRTLQFDVSLAASGEEALTLLARAAHDAPYKIVVMDWLMPGGMDGIETARRIKTHTDWPSIPPVILVTAFGRNEAMARAEEAGLDGFLAKPVSQSVLFDTIAEAMNRDGLRSSLVRNAGMRPPETTSLFGTRVLLVEDNDINQQVACEFLENAGLTVTVAGNGSEAVDLVLSEEFDAVLMDIQMPVMDGYEASRRIREHGAFAGLPIIAMTANAMAGDRERCLEAGMDDHVAKPINPGALLTTLARCLGREPMLPSKSGISAANNAPLVLDGVDTKEGLARVAGNTALYHQLLSRFAATQAEASAVIRKAYSQGHMEDAQRAAHTLKGVAANLGARDLATHAGRIEEMFHTGFTEDGFDMALRSMEQVLMEMVGAINAMEPGRPKREAKPVAALGEEDVAVIQRLLEELARLLDTDLAAAMERMDTLDLFMLTTPLRDIYARLRAALDDFDTETARALVHDMAMHPDLNQENTK